MTQTTVLRTPTKEPDVLGTTALQRSAGRLAISFKRRGDDSALDSLYQSGCAKARLPRREAARPLEAVLINTSGGLTDGDRFETETHWKEGTLATVTSQAAERIYRSRGTAAVVDNHLRIDADATALWLPQETIVFDGGRLKRRNCVDLAASARLLASEAIILGRHAMGEHLVTGMAQDAWDIRIDGRLALAERFRLQGAISEDLMRPAVARGAKAVAMVVFAGPEAEAVRDRIRPVIDASALVGGCSCLGLVTLVRLTADTGQALRAGLVTVLDQILALLSDNDCGSNTRGGAMLPRVWAF